MYFIGKTDMDNDDSLIQAEVSVLIRDRTLHVKRRLHHGLRFEITILWLINNWHFLFAKFYLCGEAASPISLFMD